MSTLYDIYIEKEYQKYIRKNTTLGLQTLGEKSFPCGKQHDYWSAYLIGDEIKYVYFKNGYIHPDEPKKNKPLTLPKNNNIVTDSERLKNSLSRTRSTVFELAKCNEFNFFCTFTLDKNLRDRNDLGAFVKSFGQFVRDMNRKRENKITYLCLPEQHTKGGWHLHGLLNNLEIGQDLVPFKKSDYIPKKLINRIENGENIYNFPLYAKKFGYFTATKIKDKNACSKYITKYITKDLQSEILDCGKHLFYASKGLNRKECIVKNSFEQAPFSDWDFENEYIKIKTVKI